MALRKTQKDAGVQVKEIVAVVLQNGSQPAVDIDGESTVHSFHYCGGMLMLMNVIWTSLVGYVSMWRLFLSVLMSHVHRSAVQDGFGGS